MISRYPLPLNTEVSQSKIFTEPSPLNSSLNLWTSPNLYKYKPEHLNETHNISSVHFFRSPEYDDSGSYDRTVT